MGKSFKIRFEKFDQKIKKRIIKNLTMVSCMPWFFLLKYNNMYVKIVTELCFKEVL